MAKCKSCQVGFPFFHKLKDSHLKWFISRLSVSGLKGLGWWQLKHSDIFQRKTRQYPLSKLALTSSADLSWLKVHFVCRPAKGLELRTGAVWHRVKEKKNNQPTKKMLQHQILKKKILLNVNGSSFPYGFWAVRTLFCWQLRLEASPGWFSVFT